MLYQTSPLHLVSPTTKLTPLPPPPPPAPPTTTILSPVAVSVDDAAASYTTATMSYRCAPTSLCRPVRPTYPVHVLFLNAIAHIPQFFLLLFVALFSGVFSVSELRTPNYKQTNKLYCFELDILRPHKRRQNDSKSEMVENNMLKNIFGVSCDMAKAYIPEKFNKNFAVFIKLC